MADYTIKARPTIYDGIRMRSRLEARFAADLEPPCELLLRRVDETAGPNYQPASRLRPSD